MRVLAAGMRRAGSMWLYNVARTLCATKGDTQMVVQDRYAYKPGIQISVAKVHKFQEAFLFGADIILTSHRDLRDVLASAFMRSLCKQTLYAGMTFLLRTVVDEYEQWAPYATYDMRYEDMANDRLICVKQIAKILDCADIDTATICRQVDAMPVGSYADAEVVLQPRNYKDARSGIYKDVLNADIVAAVEAVFKDWQKEHGYE